MESPLALYILFGLGSLFQILAKQLGWGGHSIYIGGTWISKKLRRLWDWELKTSPGLQVASSIVIVELEMS